MSVWGGTSHDPPVVSLSDVMSEQLAKNIIDEDTQKITPFHVNQQIQESLILDDDSDNQCSSDETLARLLQREFDREFDAALKRSERVRNGDSKVAVSWERFRRVTDEDSDSGDEEFDPEFGPECRYWDALERAQRRQVQVGGRGYAVKDGVVTTKHDSEQNHVKNAQKAMELDVRVGDGSKLKLNNAVFNSLRAHSIQEGKRLARLHEKKEKSTSDMAIDEKTKLIVFKLINRGILDEVNGVVATGKESIVLHARGQDMEHGITNQEMCIKVYKTTLNEFKARDAYVNGDPRFAPVNKLTKQNPRTLIPIWAEKERDNLRRLRHNNIHCPDPVFLKKNVLVMTFIGKDARPAPTLNKAVMSDDDLTKAWEQCKDLMISIYRDCELVHGDLSEYNLLWHERRVYVIDVSQAVLTTHPNAYVFLWRDCLNICKFFSRRLIECASPRELFEWITGKSLGSDCEDTAVELLSKIANYKCVDPDADSFEEMLERSEKERESHK